MRKRILGLDLGISSIGWAIVDTDNGEIIDKSTGEIIQEQPSIKIVDCGVRLFDAPLDKDDKGYHGTLNSIRREKRLTRRRLKRKKIIMLKLKQLFVEKGLTNNDEIGLFFNDKNKINNKLMLLPKNLEKNIDIWELRDKAIKEKLEDFELCRVLLHIAKHRGPDFEKNLTLDEKEKLNKKEKKQNDVIEEINNKKEKKEITESEQMQESMFKLKEDYLNAKKENNNITIGSYLFKQREIVKNEIGEYKVGKNGHIVYEKMDSITNSTERKDKNGKSIAYRYIIPRDFLREEVDKIFEKQKEYSDSGIHKLNCKEYKELVFSETKPKLNLIENMVGFCELEFKTKVFEKINRKGKKIKCEIIDYKNSEKRLSKDTFTGQIFSALNAILTTRIYNGNEYSGYLIDYIDKNNKKEAIKKVLKLAIFNEGKIRSELTYTKLKEKFLDESFRFKNLSYKSKTKKDGTELSDKDLAKKVEDQKFISFKSLYQLNKILSDIPDWKNILEEILDIDKIVDFYCSNKDQKLKIDNIIDIIYLNNEDNIVKKLKEDGNNYSDDFINLVKNLDFKKTLNLSHKAIRKILPLMFNGEQYSTAIDKIDEYKAKFEKEKDYILKDYAELELVKNPVIRRIFAEIKKLINGLINKKIKDPITGEEKYLYRQKGEKTVFHQINIETTKELKDALSKDKYTKKRDENSKEALKKQYLELLGLPEDTNVSSNEIFKFKLLKEQDFQSAYKFESTGIGKEIFVQMIRNNSIEIQVDHILPYSRSFDDSQNNKVLVLSGENQEKGDKTPYEWLKEKYKDNFEEKWNEFKGRIKNYPKEKRANLLNKTFGEQENDFQSRNLNDTGYISKFLGTYLERHLKFNEIEGLKNHVQRRSGALTSTLRECWSDEFNHSKEYNKLLEFLKTEILKKYDIEEKNGNKYTKYKVERIEQSHKLTNDVKEKIISFFENNKDVSEKFILENLIEILPDYKSEYDGISEGALRNKIKESMKWSGFWRKENKDRNLSDKHHALDAILVAIADQGMVQSLSIVNSKEKEKLFEELKNKENSKETLENSKRRYKNLLKKIFKVCEINDKESDKYFRDYVEEFLEERKIKEDGEYFEDYLKKLDKYLLEKENSISRNEKFDKKFNEKCRLFISKAPKNRITGELFKATNYTDNQKYKNKIKKPKNYNDRIVSEEKRGVLVEFDKNNIIRDKKDRFNFFESESWARADIFSIEKRIKKGIQRKYKIQEVFKKDKALKTPEIKDGESLKFLFSLNTNNLVYIKDTENSRSFLGFYRSSNNSGAKNVLLIKPIDYLKFNNYTSYRFEKGGLFGVSIGTAKYIKKLQIDSLGYISLINKENRIGINKNNKNGE